MSVNLTKLTYSWGIIIFIKLRVSFCPGTDLNENEEGKLDRRQIYNSNKVVTQAISTQKPRIWNHRVKYKDALNSITRRNCIMLLLFWNQKNKWARWVNETEWISILTYSMVVLFSLKLIWSFEWRWFTHTRISFYKKLSVNQIIHWKDHQSKSVIIINKNWNSFRSPFISVHKWKRKKWKDPARILNLLSPFFIPSVYFATSSLTRNDWMFSRCL